MCFFFLFSLYLLYFFLFYLKDCAMDTIRAPTCANIFMGQFEKLHIYPYFRNFSLFYCRFIDDIFFLWNGTESELIKYTVLTKNILQ